METTLSPALVEALAIAGLPEVMWEHGDDLCDCTFQRIGQWKNPLLAETLEIRMCCIFVKLAEMFPDLVRTIPAYYNSNTDEWVTETSKWNGEDEMPKAIWYRQLAREQGVGLAAIREQYGQRDDLRPRGKPIQPKSPFFLKWGDEYVPVALGR